MSRAKEYLAEVFPGITFTDAILSPAYGKSDNSAKYSNMLAQCDTDMSADDLNVLFKQIESKLDDTPALRAEGTVMMDIDLLKHGDEKHHRADWQRHYIKRLLKLLPRQHVILSLVALSITISFATTSLALRNGSGIMSSQQQHDETSQELLTKAIEYFQGGKYHEAILAFTKLQKKYTLSPRFMAYLGMSYYKEGMYEEAAFNLKKGIPALTAFSPKEQAVYIYYCAESLFNMGEYKEALTYYDLALPLVEGNDKGDVIFHTAFAHYLMEGVSEDTAPSIYDMFSQALSLYEANQGSATELQHSRLRQTRSMLNGLKPYLPKENEPEDVEPTDSLDVIANDSLIIYTDTLQVKFTHSSED